MSALESPPTLGTGWQDPWTTGQIDPHQAHLHPHQMAPHMGAHAMAHDYYGKYQMYPQIATSSAPVNQPMPGYYPGVCETPSTGSNPQQTQSSPSSNSSTGETHNNNSIKKHRSVNFKLEIKPEPLNNTSETLTEGGAPSCDMLLSGAAGIQKVPSLSDCSDQESCSLDIPPTQVGRISQING